MLRAYVGILEFPCLTAHCFLTLIRYCRQVNFEALCFSVFQFATFDGEHLTSLRGHCRCLGQTSVDQVLWIGVGFQSAIHLFKSFFLLVRLKGFGFYHYFT